MSASNELKGAKAIVTGGAVGIGRAIVQALSAAGARVAVADLDIDAARTTARHIKDARAVAIDVRKRASVEAAFGEIENAFDGYDVLVANAGVSTMSAAVDLTDEEWSSNFDVNAKGVFLTNQIAVRQFLRRDIAGRIVNTASLAAKIAAPLLAHYSASKFAVVGWTQALAREMAPHGIRVNAVCPGFVRTAMQEREVAWEAQLRNLTPGTVLASYVAQTPLGRLQEPEDVAGTVVFLASSASGFITGEAINVSGGTCMD